MLLILVVTVGNEGEVREILGRIWNESNDAGELVD